MESEFLCNYSRCRKPISCQAWVTSCSHIFCYEDGLRELEKALVCPACQNPLPGKYDAVKIDLDLSEQYKSMLLAGQRPETILDVCSRAISFWTYQIHQEIVYQQYMSKRSEEKQKKFEKYYEDILNKAKNQVEHLNEELNSKELELDTLRKKVADVTEKLSERTRQNQKLQYLYEALRRKLINPNLLDRNKNFGSENILERTAPNFGMAPANDVLFSVQPGSAHSTKSRKSKNSDKSFPFHPHPNAGAGAPSSVSHDFRSQSHVPRKYYKI